jgi:hypothetical protein
MCPANRIGGMGIVGIAVAVAVAVAVTVTVDLDIVRLDMNSPFWRSGRDLRRILPAIMER